MADKEISDPRRRGQKMKYRIEVSEEQLRVIGLAVDEYMRLRMGQFDALAEELALDGVADRIEAYKDDYQRGILNERSYSMRVLLPDVAKCVPHLLHESASAVSITVGVLLVDDGELGLCPKQVLVLLNRDSDGLDVQIFHNRFLSSRMMRTTLRHWSTSNIPICVNSIGVPIFSDSQR